MSYKTDERIDTLFKQYKRYMQDMIPKATSGLFRIPGMSYSCSFNEMIITINLGSSARIKNLDFLFDREVKITISTLAYKNLLKKSRKTFNDLRKSDSAVNLFGNTPKFFFHTNSEKFEALTAEEYRELIFNYSIAYHNALYNIVCDLKKEIDKIKEEEKEANND